MANVFHGSENQCLLGKKYYTTSVIRIEGVSPFSGVFVGEAIRYHCKVIVVSLFLVISLPYVISLKSKKIVTYLFVYHILKTQAWGVC
jgi:hypothetical protein